ncbi:hypothetical protein KDX27_14735 [Burkholderia cenocepacia]|uniref:hypothetical protein n=1 Tax=Burkholderia cenocepacia TaxID=95486 RepID=UPI001B9DB019|nr:hypothetical protein [Burkholderia cenocepacia]MBR8168974.1 hypothetical protein [Burkholderia cenocepacia]MBR8425046.1 hypothetical protein [Burkholderia cenocepacia]
MKKLLIKLAAFEAAFFLVLAPLVAVAQSYPTPTFSSLTLQNPLAVSSGGTGTTTSTGTGSVVRGTSPTIASPTITGGFTATGLVTLPSLAVQAANTVVANVTGSSASPSAFAMPGCSSSTSALQWTSGTGFTCYGSSASLTGATFTGALGASFNSASFTLNDAGGAGFPALFINKAGVNVWAFTNNSSSGLFTLNRYVSGTLTDSPISVSNSTGVVTFTDGITSNAPAIVSYNSPVLALNDSGGAGKGYMQFQKSGTAAWNIGNASSASNQLGIDRYVSGSYVDTPFTISNTTGVVSMSDGMTAAGGINSTPIGATTPAAGTFTFVGVPTLVSGATQFTLGADPGQGGSVLWNSALSRIGGNLTLDANLGNNSNDEFLTVIEANQQATSMITLTTTASTSTSSNVLTFSSVPSTIKIGMAISDSTSVNAIQQLFVTATTATTVTMSGTPLSTVGSGDTIVFGFQNFKGPLYLGANCFDSSTWQFTRACNALTSYTTIQNGVTHGYAEGTVVMADAVGTGDGLMIAGEFDIGPQANPNSNHCDQSGLSNCHTNFWVANFGTVRGSWMLDSAAGGPGWNNGLALRNIAAGGLAVQIPNNTVIASTDSTGATIYNLIYAGTDNNVHVGTGASSIAADAPLNVGVYGIIGTQDGSSAAADRVGEKLSHSTTGTSMSTGTTINGDSLPLTAGDWDVQAIGRCNASSASVQTCAVGVSQTSATFGSFGSFSNANPQMAAGTTTTSNYAITTPRVPITVGSPTTVYCVMAAQFSSGSMTGDCALQARRVR